ncbi:B3/B4 domain-containing protein [Vagococcus zengguangii]|uniref:B3/B4 domain-containing protein n=1 Tax=Vagococcus zengguangii TaxID=2571750 RepID=UPI001FE586C0|nr:phenylalanine--tRNA ligase beta subunit-related protein [Vagococcus zengguangii]
MKNFIIEPSFWEIFPDAEIYFLHLPIIDNHHDNTKEAYLNELLKKATQEAQYFLPDENFSQNDVIQEWRQAFSKFKTKKGARSSIEALLKRANQGHEFQSINPLVDLYNSISLKYAVPCGGEDFDKIAGDFHLGKAQGGEPFFPLGADTDAPALPEEIIYYDDDGAICRCLNWREAQRTMLTEETTEAILVIEAINDSQRSRAKEAINELKQLSDHYFNISNSSIFSLTQSSPKHSID